MLILIDFSFQLFDVLNLLLRLLINFTHFLVYLTHDLRVI
jgi:hypothetical protein